MNFFYQSLSSFMMRKLKKAFAFTVKMTPDQYNFFRVREHHVPESDVSQCHSSAMVRSRCLSLEKQTWQILLLWGELDIY